MMSEILIGRRGRRNPIATMKLLGQEEGDSERWKWVGVMAVSAGVLILSYYSVIAGWTIAYVPKAIFGEFAGKFTKYSFWYVSNRPTCNHTVVGQN